MNLAADYFLDLRGLRQYQEKLLRMKEDCELNGRSYGAFVGLGLSHILGETAAQAVLYQIGFDTVSDPDLLVEKLAALFRNGAPIILRELVAHWELGVGMELRQP